MTDPKDGALSSNRTPQSIEAVSRFGSFFGNDNHAFLVKKAERLASAIHVVTGFISADEPLRARLRNLSLEVVQNSVNLDRLGEVGVEAYGTECATIAALLETAQAAGLVSSMNARMICDEYLSLATFLRDRYASIRARTQDFKDMPPPQIPIGFYKGQKDIPSYKTPQKTDSPSKGQINDGRKKDILSLFANKERISIKDAVSAVPGVSEKTIQRDLLALVEAGVLIKEGERRWSTYKKA